MKKICYLVLLLAAGLQFCTSKPMGYSFTGYIFTAGGLFGLSALIGKIVIEIEKCCQPTLHDAAFLGDLEQVKRCLARGDNLRAIDTFGNTPFHAAARGNNIPILEFLLQNDVSIDTPGLLDRTALFTACLYSKPKTVRWLLRHGVAVNKLDAHGNTPLMVVLLKDEPTLDNIEELLLWNANTEVQNSFGNSPDSLAKTKAIKKIIQDPGAHFRKKFARGSTVPLRLFERQLGVKGRK